MPLSRIPIRTIQRLQLICTLAGLLMSGPLHAALRWPQFRGPAGTGLGDADFPADIAPGKHQLWSVETPPGHSSPILWDHRLFLTAFVDGQLRTLCFDARSGALLWQHDVAPGTIEKGSGNGNPACSTPVTDGRRVYVYFGSFGVIAYSCDGRELWRKAMPTPVTQHGASASPILAGGKLILARDQDVDSHLLALEAASGRELWRADRPGFRRGFSTPLPWPPERPRSVILPGTLQLVAYDLQKGTEQWHVNGLPNETVASATAGDGLIFFAGWTPGSGVRAMPTFDAQLAAGDRDHDSRLTRDESPNGPARQHFAYLDANKDGFIDRNEWESLARILDAAQNVALAVRPGGKGDVTATHVLWRQTRGLPYVPTPLYYEGRLFLIKNGGLASCFDAKSGRPLYQEERIGALGDYYASPVAAGGKIVVASQAGWVSVLQSADTLQVLAQHSFGEPIMATPALAGGRVFIRTAQHLFAFGLR